MAVVQADFHPVVVSNGRLADGTPSSLIEQLPHGTDPGALRIVRARDVRPGDWYLGAFDHSSPSEGRFHRSVHSVAAYVARPRRRWWRRKVSLDGTRFHWYAHELVMIVPWELLPQDEDDWMGESFIWEPGDLQAA